MLLLDTCAMIWLADGGAVFPKRVVEGLRSNAGGIQISAISAFEIAVLFRKGGELSCRRRRTAGTRTEDGTMD